ncbi:MAG: hypothetical protein OSA98_19995 [Rubripirellula sp.]|nr:hypothetical protein [Rubripirellula sp.]
MSRFNTLFLTAISCLIGCSESPPTATHSPPGEQESRLQLRQNATIVRVSELDNVLEALFRHQFENNVSGTQQQADSYFLTVKKTNPSPEFLKRFSGHTPPVRNGSNFAIGKGIEFRIDSWIWISDNKVELTGGYFAGMLNASGNSYTLVRKDGEWVVKNAQMVVIS